MRWVSGVLLTFGCATSHPPPVVTPCPEPAPVAARPDDTAIRSALEAFVRAVQARDFVTALSLMDGSWRRRYSPERLGRDFEREPGGALLVGRLERGLSGTIELVADGARLRVAEGRAVTLRREDGAWRISSLDAALP